MTLEQIRKMTDEEIEKSVALSLGWNGFYRNQTSPKRLRGRSPGAYGRNIPVPRYSTDLNAAMSLVPQDVDNIQSVSSLDFHEALCATLDTLEPCDKLVFLCHNKPRVLCEAYLLWKDGAK